MRRPQTATRVYMQIFVSLVLLYTYFLVPIGVLSRRPAPTVVSKQAQCEQSTEHWLMTGYRCRQSSNTATIPNTENSPGLSRTSEGTLPKLSTSSSKSLPNVPTRTTRIKRTDVWCKDSANAAFRRLYPATACRPKSGSKKSSARSCSTLVS